MNYTKTNKLTRTLQTQLAAINRGTFERLSPVDPMLGSLRTSVLLYCIESCTDVPVLHCIFPLQTVNELNDTNIKLKRKHRENNDQKKTKINKTKIAIANSRKEKKTQNFRFTFDLFYDGKKKSMCAKNIQTTGNVCFPLFQISRDANHVIANFMQSQCIYTNSVYILIFALIITECAHTISLCIFSAAVVIIIVVCW